MKPRFFLVLLLASAMMLQLGCNLLDAAVSGVSNAVGLTDTATVISKTAQIRTSYAVVAADLLEVKRGERLDVIDQIDFEKVLWYRVRARDEENTEGWIEAQHVITNEVLQKSQTLAGQFQNLSPQASGKLRAASNLRLAPDMNPENVLFKLGNGSTFEIMDWNFVPKQEVADVDDAAKGETKNRSGRKTTRSKRQKLPANRKNLMKNTMSGIWYEWMHRFRRHRPAGFSVGRLNCRFPAILFSFNRIIGNLLHGSGWIRTQRERLSRPTAMRRRATG